eukprot:COSAG05_NODE_4860_length_1345_cov_1.891653_2_plen_181_part_00
MCFDLAFVRTRLQLAHERSIFLVATHCPSTISTHLSPSHWHALRMLFACCCSTHRHHHSKPRCAFPKVLFQLVVRLPVQQLLRLCRAVFACAAAKLRQARTRTERSVGRCPLYGSTEKREGQSSNSARGNGSDCGSNVWRPSKERAPCGRSAEMKKISQRLGSRCNETSIAHRTARPASA